MTFLRPIIFFIFLCTSLYAEESAACRSIEEMHETNSIIDLQAAPNNVVGGCVNAISGHYFESHEDLVIGGSNPFAITRFCSTGSCERGPLEYMWDLNIHDEVDFRISKDAQGLNIGVSASVEYGGLTIPFEGLETEDPLWVDKRILKSGFANSCSPYLSGQTHIKNKTLRRLDSRSFKMYCSGLETAYFTAKSKGMTCDCNALLRGTTRADGCTVSYKYSGDEACFIGTFGRDRAITGSIDIERKKGKSLTLRSHDGRSVVYHLKKQKSKNSKKKRRIFLDRVEKSFGPTTNYVYETRKRNKKERLIRKEMPDQRFVGIEYGKKGKVEKILSPAGVDAAPVPVFTFDYDSKKTNVRDALGFKKSYRRDKESRLLRIRDYDEKDHRYRQERFHWKKKDPTLLKTRTIENEKGEILIAKHFRYDNDGNIVEECLCGNISGQSVKAPVLDKNNDPVLSKCEYFSKRYSHNRHNLVIKETSGDQTIQYSYYPNTNRIRLKTVSDGKKIRLRYYYEYDPNNAVRVQILDNGSSLEISDLTDVTERKIERTVNHSEGRPLEVQYLYLDLATGQEVLLRRSKQEFSPAGQMTRQTVFDPAGAQLYTKEWVYDSWGRVAEETDALGYTIRYAYDANSNCILKETDKARFHFTYDFSNRLIKEEIEAEGERFPKTHHYDLKGNKTLSRDIYGNETLFAYDPFGRVVKRTLPFIPDASGALRSYEEEYRYNPLNQLIEKKDAEGRVTKMAYNIHGKPTRKENPDGSVEQWIYNKNGTLKETIDPMGMRTCFSYDFLQRKTAETKFSPAGELLSTHQWNYDVFHLLSEVEPDGTLVEYTYDAAGRQISEVRGGKETLYRYDALERVSEKWEKISEGSYRVSILEKDLKDQILEERIEDEKGTLFLKKQYRYDSYGNRTEEVVWTSSGPSRTLTEYNALNLPKKIIAPDGAETYFLYRFDYIDASGQMVPYAEMIDSLGNMQITVKNSHDQIAFEQTKNVYGGVVKETRYFYDGLQHPLQRLETLLVDGTAEKTVTTAFEYDEMGRETGILEAHGDPEQKVTRRSYYPSGSLAKIYKPDGVVLDHHYDALGRLSDLRSSDGSIAIHYTYDLANRMISAQQGDAVTKRSYNIQGLMEREILDHGATVDYAYDQMGRLKRLTLPDASEIHYGYNAGYLTEVRRGEQTHHYSYDLSGKRSKVTTPVTEIAYSYDACLRPVKIASSYLTIDLAYDSLGNVIRSSQKGTVPADQEYGYDALQQLTHETGTETHQYRYDSMGNRLSKNSTGYTNNSLNQLLRQGDTSYEYDPNGNLIRTVRGQELSEYRYDALDRLIEVSRGQERIRYTYDPLHRRTKKSILTPGREKEEFYLYHDEKECGTLDAEGVIVELKVMGIGSKGDVGAAVFIELAQKSYVPLHDHRGNIVLLCDLSGKVIESYQYTAFGEEKVSDPINPWRFSSKRVDPETGWIYFGRRFYDPQTGRWTTADPLWFADGSNLYCYVHNRPTLFIDPDGLSAEGVLHILKETFVDVFVQLAIPYEYEDEYKQNPNYGGREFPSRSDGGIDHRSHAVYRKNTDLYNKPRIMFGNGILNQPEDMRESMDYIYDMGFDAGLSGVYNGSKGLWDCAEYLYNLCCHGETRPVTLFQREFDDYFNNCQEDGIIILVVHSQGAALARNALESYDPEKRNRIHVIAVGPGAYIDKHLCGSVTHLTSQGDVVHWIDFPGAARNPHTTVSIPRHAKAKGLIDHEFKSPTFNDAIRKNIQGILDTHKKKKS